MNSSVYSMKIFLSLLAHPFGRSLNFDSCFSSSSVDRVIIMIHLCNTCFVLAGKKPNNGVRQEQDPVIAETGIYGYASYEDDANSGRARAREVSSTFVQH